MKGLVERELNRYITEEQFVKAMKELGYTYSDGHFNSILVYRVYPQQDKCIATKWGYNKHAIATWKKRNGISGFN